MNNWFPKNSDHFWRGLYKCAHKDCDIKFKATIENEKACLIVLHANRHCEHDLEIKKTRCSGKAREETKMKLLAFSALKVQSENVLLNEICKTEEGNI